MQTLQKANSEWRVILDKLSRELPDGDEGLIRQRKQGGKLLDYIEWSTAADMLDDICPLWKNEILSESIVGKNLVMRVRVYIWSEELSEWIYRENVGIEELETSSYGDTASNAFAMAFKRACALFGLGRSLYKAPDYKPYRQASFAQVEELDDMIAKKIIPESNVSGIIKLLKSGEFTQDKARAAIKYYKEQAEETKAAKTKPKTKAKAAEAKDAVASAA